MDNMYLYSHVNIVVDYHQSGNPAVEASRVVAFLVEPLSIEHEY